MPQTLTVACLLAQATAAMLPQPSHLDKVVNDQMYTVGPILPLLLQLHHNSIQTFLHNTTILMILFHMHVCRMVLKLLLEPTALRTNSPHTAHQEFGQQAATQPSLGTQRFVAFTGTPVRHTNHTSSADAVHCYHTWRTVPLTLSLLHHACPMAPCPACAQFVTQTTPVLLTLE
jgi:hypothetical protein